LTNDTPAASSQRQPHGNLAPPAGRACQEEIRDIRTSNQQHQRDHGHQYAQWRLVLLAHVGVASRSGGMSVAAAYYLSQTGIGVSSLVHVGGDAVVGMGLHEVALRFAEDEQTKVIVLIGEVGTSQEEQVAELMLCGKIRKPVVVFIGGRAARKGMRYSHAGALVEGTRGSYASKCECLMNAGAIVAGEFSQIPRLVQQCL
jgi:succinyl-CoA synthetase alpha subunit